MNGVLGLLELLKAGELREKQRGYVNMALSSSVALLNIINDILDFSKMEAGRMELITDEFDLYQSVEEAVNLFTEQTESKKLELMCHILPDVPRRVNGDVTRLRQVLINLIGNAVKFTDRGEIIVRVARVDGGADYGVLRFEVQDTGVGIPAEAQAKIFESFSQADTSTTRKFGGTGLGLTIARQLVHMMKGAIGVTSYAGEGSMFWFTARLGLTPVTAEPQTDNSADPVCSRIKNLRVLVVDDNATNRRILEDMLLAWGLVPVSVADGIEALENLLSALTSGLPFQLVILDMMMPGMDGLQLAERIRNTETLSMLPIIMLTSHDGIDEARSGKDLGIVYRLVKPVRQSQVLNAISGAMGIRAAEPVRLADRELAGSLPGISVLLVEDHPVNLAVGKAMLQHLGCTVEVAVNGKIAVDLVAHNIYNIVLMDCQMPEMDGYEATAAIRASENTGQNNAPRNTIIALTAHALDGDREKSLDAGMDDHLSKPFTIDQLKDIMEKHIKAGSVSYPAREADTDKPSRVIPELADDKTGRSRTDGFDRTALEKIQALDTQGSSTLVKTIVDHYLVETPKIVALLKDAVRNNNAPGIRNLAHSLKSASANVGAVALAEICRETEAAGKAKTIEDCPGLVAMIEQEYLTIKTVLEAET
jgi:two-component system sensor histidine kinase/response regulator